MLHRPFRRVGERVEVSLRAEEADALAGLPSELRAMLGDATSAPGVHDRLFPRAYVDPTEEEAEREWQRLMHDDLLASKLAALEVLEASLARATPRRRGVRIELDAEQAAAWLGALNDLRLALGVVLGVTEDLDLSSLDPRDPARAPHHLYGWLTWLQAELVEALGEPV